MERADESLSSAKALLKIGNLKDSVALAYYAMYHSLLSLLFYTGIKCENHTAAIILLKQVYGINPNSILQAKAERIDKQYYVDFRINKAEVEEAINAAEDFISNIVDFIDRSKNEKIKEYRKIAQELIEQ